MSIAFFLVYTINRRKPGRIVTQQRKKNEVTCVTDTKQKIYLSAKNYSRNGLQRRFLTRYRRTCRHPIGNLTYHFPKKEAIMLRLQEELYSTFFNFVDCRNHRRKCLKPIKKFDPRNSRNPKDQHVLLQIHR